MQNSDIKDPVFRNAVEAIDLGDLSALSEILSEYPSLINTRLNTPVQGYFAHPYLLWFVADNPIRHPTLPENITAIASLLIRYARQFALDSLQFQLDYTLGLVATGRIPRESGVQLALMDLLIDEGAVVGSGIGALAHGNPDAARKLLERSGQLTLPTAVGLNMIDEIPALLKSADQNDKQVALMMAAFYGKHEMIQLLLSNGADPNKFITNDAGFHSHASPLHQAVYSQSLESVKLLVNAGADLTIKDIIYHSTPIGWANYAQTGDDDNETKNRYAEIEQFLLSKQ